MWELASRLFGYGFMAELPEGEYCIGDPSILLLPGFLPDIPEHDGVYQDIESDSIIIVINKTENNFTVSGKSGFEFYSESGILAVMSRDIVRPDFQDNIFNFDNRVVVEYDGENLNMANRDVQISVTEYSYDPSDEEMYANALSHTAY